MSDLISRSEVIKIIDELGYINCHDGKDFEANNRVDKIRQMVVEMPVAYDVDKVAEQIKCNSQDIALLYQDDKGGDYEYAYGIEVNKAIEIIKAEKKE